MASDAGAAGAAAFETAKEWYQEAAQRDDAGDAHFCVPWWQLYVVVAVAGCLFICLGIGVACCCGPLCFLGGRAWARRSLPPPTARDHLERLADYVQAGGQPAEEAAAARLSVSPTAVRAWLVQWRRA